MACNLSGQAYLKWLNNIRTNEYTHKQRMNCEHTQQNTQYGWAMHTEYMEDKIHIGQTRYTCILMSNLNKMNCVGLCITQWQL